MKRAARFIASTARARSRASRSCPAGAPAAAVLPSGARGGADGLALQPSAIGDSSDVTKARRFIIEFELPSCVVRRGRASLVALYRCAAPSASLGLPSDAKARTWRRNVRRARLRPGEVGAKDGRSRHATPQSGNHGDPRRAASTSSMSNASSACGVRRARGLSTARRAQENGADARLPSALQRADVCALEQPRMRGTR